GLLHRDDAREGPRRSERARGGLAVALDSAPVLEPALRRLRAIAQRPVSQREVGRRAGHQVVGAAIEGALAEIAGDDLDPIAHPVPGNRVAREGEALRLRLDAVAARRGKA